MADEACAIGYLERVFRQLAVFFVVALDVFIQFERDGGDVAGEIPTKEFVE